MPIQGYSVIQMMCIFAKQYLKEAQKPFPLRAIPSVIFQGITIKIWEGENNISIYKSVDSDC
jgi:tetrahydromethanopterin S-methyltransferase subunit E